MSFMCLSFSEHFWAPNQKYCYRSGTRSFPCKILTEILAEISASFWPARLPRSRRDLKISAAKNSPRFSLRSHRDLKISSRFSPRSQNLGAQNLSENLDKISSKIFGRSQSLKAATTSPSRESRQDE